VRNLTTGTWVSVGEGCQVRCDVDGSDLAHLVIGRDDHSVELIFDVEGLRNLAATSSRAVAEMDSLFEQEASQRARVARTTETCLGS
jgi:hypothetical protein